MQEWLGIGLTIAVLAAGAMLIRRARRIAATGNLFVDPITTRRQEPCWTEEIAGGDGLSYGRGQCVNDTLMDVDALAREPGFGGQGD